MLCGLTRPAIEAGLVGEIDQQTRCERANRERRPQMKPAKRLRRTRQSTLTEMSTEMGTGGRATQFLPVDGQQASYRSYSIRITRILSVLELNRIVEA